jgi:NAD kinase
MLRAIREHWRRRLPFFGVNAGHLGFLMNAPDSVFAADLPPKDVIFRQLPLLYIEMETKEGQIITTYGFNDAWVERSTSQSAWFQVNVNGIPRLPKLVSDGALVCTAAGSTAYARSMGASPLLADTPAWLLVGSNVMEPAHWKSALLSVDSTIEIISIGEDARPVVAYVDGVPQGEVRSIKARLSRAATAELVFLANHDMAEKIAAIQFAMTDAKS